MNCIKCQKEHSIDNKDNAKIKFICCDIKQIHESAPGIGYYVDAISPVTLKAAVWMVSNIKTLNYGSEIVIIGDEFNNTPEIQLIRKLL